MKASITGRSCRPPCTSRTENRFSKNRLPTTVRVIYFILLYAFVLYVGEHIPEVFYIRRDNFSDAFLNVPVLEGLIDSRNNITDVSAKRFYGKKNSLSLWYQNMKSSIEHFSLNQFTLCGKAYKLKKSRKIDHCFLSI